MKRIISYNVNGIRAALKKGFAEWLSEAAPDIIHIQETKAQPEQIDTKILKDLGYHCHAFSAEKKGYSGVATFSKTPPSYVKEGMGLAKYDSEGRVLRTDFGDLTLINAYFPSGSSGDLRQAYKMDFLADFQVFIDDLKKERPNIVVSGDFNICHLWIDIHNPEKQQQTSGFLPEERQWVDQFVESGFADSFREIDPNPDHYSWWSYRANSRARNKGWRIDYNMVTTPLQGKITHASILPEAQHSDHCPVLVELDF